MTEPVRAAVTRMGGFTPDGQPIGWQFDVGGDQSLVRHTMVAGRLVEIAGWTTEELLAMWLQARQLHEQQETSR